MGIATFSSRSELAFCQLKKGFARGLHLVRKAQLPLIHRNIQLPQGSQAPGTVQASLNAHNTYKCVVYQSEMHHIVTCGVT